LEPAQPTKSIAVSDDFARRLPRKWKDNERNFGQAENQWLIIDTKPPVDQRSPCEEPMGPSDGREQR
jgi:hypothetical protein